MTDIFNLERQCTYRGVEYEVVEVLENDLLLVVNKADMKAERYPLQTLIIPDIQVIEDTRKMR